MNKKYNSVRDNNDVNLKYNFALFVPQIKNDNWRNEDGKVVLCIKTTNPVKKALSWMVKKNPMTLLDLDDRCSAAWIYIDGRRTIYDIARLMSERYKEDINNELYRLITYLKFMSKRGWIKFKKNEA